MPNSKETRIGKATVVDYGQPEYLDGAQMQYNVVLRKRGEASQYLAYFAEEAHAFAFAELIRDGKLKPKN